MSSKLEKIIFHKWETAKFGSVYLIYCIWFLLAAFAVLAEMSRGLTGIDNYLIFEGVFKHVVQEKYLFSYYPEEYVSFNNYGPAFSLVIAPFALLPTYIGCFFWAMANAAALFIALKMLPLEEKQKIILYWIVLIEMMTSIHSVQFNPMFTAFFIFTFVFTLRGKDWIATLFIALGILTKLYGIAGLAFFFFSKNKIQFIISLMVWLTVIVAAPILYSSYDYIVQSYEDWYYQIIRRNQQNIDNSRTAGMQDISVPGMIRRIFKYYGPIDFPIIAAAGVLFGIPLLKKQNQDHPNFKLNYLALVLISVVIFSSAAESPTFVIAVTGAAIWFITQQQPYSTKIKATLWLLFLLTILSPTDLIPPYIRINFILAYSLKALPCFIIWCWLIISCWKIHL
ncbi:MAG: glycosyltransferase family 87 protein, partial [Sediminibacterium sp.]|nr:glycosyltransferase family 87 protein [Sediminibacterium sp.]